MQWYPSIILVFFLVLFSSGCAELYPDSPGKNLTRFMESVNESEDYFDTLVRSSPMNATAWCYRGMYYNNVFSRYDRALESYDRGLGLDPGNGLCWYAKGTTLQNMNRSDEARICFANAKKADPVLFRETGRF